MNAAADGQNQHRGCAVNRVPRAQLSRSGLQKILRSRRHHAARRLQDREYAAHRRVDVDVARTVQRIKGKQVLAEGVGRWNLVGRLEMFGDHPRKMTAVFAGAQKDIVGYGIQLQRALRSGQRAAADDEADALAGQADVVEQRGKITRGIRKAALLLVHELGWSASRAHVLQAIAIAFSFGIQQPGRADAELPRTGTQSAARNPARGSRSSESPRHAGRRPLQP